jgi:LEA14-like dessication related protein
MRMIKRAIGTVMVAAAGMFAACVPSVDQPEVWLESARLASLGLRGGVIEVRLSVHNPNRFAVQARGLSYDLEVRDPVSEEWVAFTDGRLEGDFRVGSRDTAEVVVPVDFTYRGLGEAMRGLIDRGSFDYRLSGIVELQAPVRRDIRYRHAGRYGQAGSDD